MVHENDHAERYEATGPWPWWLYYFYERLADLEMMEFLISFAENRASEFIDQTIQWIDDLDEDFEKRDIETQAFFERRGEIMDAVNCAWKDSSLGD